MANLPPSSGPSNGESLVNFVLGYDTSQVQVGAQEIEQNFNRLTDLAKVMAEQTVEARKKATSSIYSAAQDMLADVLKRKKEVDKAIVENLLGPTQEELTNLRKRAVSQEDYMRGLRDLRAEHVKIQQGMLEEQKLLGNMADEAKAFVSQQKQVTQELKQQNAETEKYLNNLDSIIKKVEDAKEGFSEKLGPHAGWMAQAGKWAASAGMAIGAAPIHAAVKYDERMFDMRGTGASGGDAFTKDALQKMIRSQEQASARTGFRWDKEEQIKFANEAAQLGYKPEEIGGLMADTGTNFKQALGVGDTTTALQQMDNLTGKLGLAREAVAPVVAHFQAIAQNTRMAADEFDSMLQANRDMLVVMEDQGTKKRAIEGLSAVYGTASETGLSTEPLTQFFEDVRYGLLGGENTQRAGVVASLTGVPLQDLVKMENDGKFEELAALQQEAFLKVYDNAEAANPGMGKTALLKFADINHFPRQFVEEMVGRDDQGNLKNNFRETYNAGVAAGDKPDLLTEGAGGLRDSIERAKRAASAGYTELGRAGQEGVGAVAGAMDTGLDAAGEAYNKTPEKALDVAGRTTAAGALAIGIPSAIGGAAMVALPKLLMLLRSPAVRSILTNPTILSKLPAFLTGAGGAAAGTTATAAGEAALAAAAASTGTVVAGGGSAAGGVAATTATAAGAGGVGGLALGGVALTVTTVLGVLAAGAAGAALGTFLDKWMKSKGWDISDWMADGINKVKKQIKGGPDDTTDAQMAAALEKLEAKRKAHAAAASGAAAPPPPPQTSLQSTPTPEAATTPAVTPEAITKAAGSDGSLPHTKELGKLAGGKYDTWIAEAAKNNGVPVALLEEVMRQESAGNPNAVSKAGAKGLMQLMPKTAAAYGVDNPLDPRQSIEGGAKMLGDLLKSSNGDIQTVLAKYNWGSGNLSKYGMENAPAETREYIEKITGRLASRAAMGGGEQQPSALATPQKSAFDLSHLAKAPTATAVDAMSEAATKAASLPDLPPQSDAYNARLEDGLVAEGHYAGLGMWGLDETATSTDLRSGVKIRGMGDELPTNPLGAIGDRSYVADALLGIKSEGQPAGITGRGNNSPEQAMTGLTPELEQTRKELLASGYPESQVNQMMAAQMKHHGAEQAMLAKNKALQARNTSVEIPRSEIRAAKAAARAAGGFESYEKFLPTSSQDPTMTMPPEPMEFGDFGGAPKASRSEMVPPRVPDAVTQPKPPQVNVEVKQTEVVGELKKLPGLIATQLAKLLGSNEQGPTVRGHQPTASRNTGIIRGISQFSE